MSSLDCDICLYSLDKNKFLPRMLLCGHTFCSQCVSTIIDSSKLCPTCRRPLSNDSINDYPVNYIVLKLKYSAKDLEKNQEKLFEKYKGRLLKLKGEYKDLKPSLETLTDLFENNEEKVENLIDSMNASNIAKVKDEAKPADKSNDAKGKVKKSNSEAKDKVKTLENYTKEQVRQLEGVFETIRKQIKPADSSHLNSVTYPLEDRKTDFDIIAVIRSEITERKTVAAVAIINGTKKFARLALKNNFLFIHAFESRGEFDEDEDDVITFCFFDLQESLLKVDPKQSIYAFLDLTCHTKSSANRVIIEILKSSMDLGSSFLKLCTGEEGLSLKGKNYNQKYKDTDTLLNCSTFNDRYSSAVKDKIIQVKKINSYVKTVGHNSSYSKFLNRNLAFAECEFNSCYLSLLENGSFDIFKLYDSVSIDPTTCQNCKRTTTQYKCKNCNVVLNQQNCNRCRINSTQLYCQYCPAANTDSDCKFMDNSGQILTLKDTSYHMTNVVGKILDSKESFESTFEGASFGKIVDSGIAFQL